MAKRIVDEEMRFSIVVNGDPAQKELHKVDKATKELTSTNSKLRTEKRRLERQNKTSTARYKEVTAEIKKNTTTIQGNNARMNQLEKQIGVTGLTMAQLSKRASALRLAIRHSIPNDPGTKKLNAELQQVTLQMRKLRMESTGMRASIGKVADGFNRFAALGATVVAAVTGVVFSIQKFIDFNSKLSDAMSNTRKTTGLTQQEVEDLAKSFGVFKTRSTRIELLKLAEEAGRLGIEGVNNIKAFTEIANKMNVALGDDLSPEQIRDVGKATKIFKVGEKNGLGFAKAMESLGSAINHVSASGANQADFLVDFLKRTAGIGDIANISAEDVVGLAAAFDELGQTQEVSATAINKTFISMGQNVEKFAGVANVSIEEFSKLLEEDANEAMITFLNGLNRGNPSLEEMAKRLKGIEVGGTRGIQALSALAGNVDLLRQRQEQASQALIKNTSLQDEYNLKNENFAAILERIQKKLNGLLAGAKSFIEPLVRGFAKLIGVTEKHSEALERQQIKFNQLRIKIFDVNTTSQNRINLINELKRQYPKLLENIDADTVSNNELRASLKKVNQELINRIIIQRQQEKIDSQNENIADKEIQLAERRIELEEKLAEIIGREKDFELDANKDLIGQAVELKKFLDERYKGETTIFRQSVRDRRSLNLLIRNISASETFLNGERSKGNDLVKERKKLMKQLGIEETNAATSLSKSQAKRAVPILGGALDIFSGRKKSNSSGTSTDEETKKEQDLANRLLQITQNSTDAQLQAMQDGVDKELAIEDERHRRVLEKLKKRLKEEKNLNKEEREAIEKNIEAQETIHQRNRANIIDGGIDDYIDSQMAQYDREAAIRQEAHLKELNALDENQQAKEQKIKAFKRQEKELEKQHLTEVEQLLRDMLNSMDFQGFDINILSDAQVQDLKDKLVEIGIAAAEVDQIIKSLQGKSSKGAQDDFLLVGEGQADILGFTADQWQQTFKNLDDTAAKIQLIGMVVQSAANLYGMFSQAQLQQEQRAFEEFMQNNEAKKDALDRRLSNGLINERQHREQLKNLEKEEEKRRAKLRYKQAKAEKEQLLAQTISQVAFNVASVIANPVLAAIVGALGALQIAQVARQPLPAKGYEKGFYGGKFPVEREQDGKVFNAGFGGVLDSGLVSSPTVLVAEKAPEMIISGKDYGNFAPDFKQSLNRELARVRGFEGGYMSENVKGSSQDSDMTQRLINSLDQNSAILSALQQEGIMATVIANETNARELQEALEKLRKRKQSAEL